MYSNSRDFSFWAIHKVCLMSLLFTNVIAQDTVSVLKDNSRVLLCEHGASAIASFTWTKGSFTIIQGFISNGQMTIVVDSMPDKTELLLQNGSPNLRLDNIDISDEGTYTCRAAEQGSGAQIVLASELLVRVQPSAPDVQVQFDPQPSDMSAVPLNTTVTFTCTSTGGRPPPTLTWKGAPESVNPTYTSSNNSQGVGDATSTFNFTTTKYGMAYSVQCEASGPSPIQTRTSTRSFRTEPDPSATPSTPKGHSGGPGVSKAPQTGGLSTGAQAGLGVGIALGCIIGAGVLAYFFVIRKKRAGRDNQHEPRDFSDRQYENVAHPDQRVASQRPGSGSDDHDYEVPMETVHPPSQPPQSSGDYQELRPAIYQSLQKH